LKAGLFYKPAFFMSTDPFPGSRNQNHFLKNALPSAQNRVLNKTV
jgi:hypothetical protein